jgi:hypothetical protein
MNKVKVGFFSFVEVTDPSAHHSYNEWWVGWPHLRLCREIGP